jgi:D,D-heptose 1,7-bisphosphate phosphatase
LQAVILCGGLGTRLKDVIKDIPKPMAPIADKPFLDYIVTHLKDNGFNKFLFLTGYKSDIIESHFPEYDFSVENKPLGTAGAILNAFDKLEENFVLINGDTFFDIDYYIFLNFLKNAQADSAIALRATKDIDRYGFVSIDQNFKIQQFIEKTALPEDIADGYINAGIYYFSKKLLANYYKTWDGEFLSIEKDIFPHLVEKNELLGLPMGGKFIDIGIPADYYRAQKEIPDRLTQEKRPALFIDRDGTIIRDTGYVHDNDVSFYEETIDFVKKHQSKDYIIAIITNQAGIAKGKFPIEAMHKTNEAVLQKYKGEGIVIDKIVYCPYHPEGTLEEYKKKSVFRKPSAGMILSICENFKVDFKNSFMYGDNRKVDKINLPYLKSIIIEKELR